MFRSFEGPCRQCLWDEIREWLSKFESDERHVRLSGAVGRTSTFALCNVTLPWVIEIAQRGIEDAANSLRPIARAVNMFAGEVTNRPVAQHVVIVGKVPRQPLRDRQQAGRLRRQVQAPR